MLCVPIKTINRFNFHCRRAHWRAFTVFIASTHFYLLISFLARSSRQTRELSSQTEAPVSTGNGVLPLPERLSTPWRMCQWLFVKSTGFSFSGSHQAHTAGSLASLPPFCPGCVPGWWAAAGQACIQAGSGAWPGCKALGTHKTWLPMCHLHQKQYKVRREHVWQTGRGVSFNRRHPITPILASLHWLPACSRIGFTDQF